MTSLLDAINAEEIIDIDMIKSEEISENKKLDKIVEAIGTMNARFVKIHDIINDTSDGLDP